MKRLVSLLVCVLIFSVGISWGQTVVNGAKPTPDHVLLTWMENPATSITISWRTDTTVNVGVVQYAPGKSLKGSVKKASASYSDLTTDLGISRLFRVTLKNLSSNKQYSYQVGTGNVWSKSYNFVTADPKSRSFKFLVFGDSQSSASGNAPYSVWSTTLNNALKANPDAKFITLTGDLVDIGQSGAHWEGWLNAGAGVIDSLPLMPALGNHETYGNVSVRRPAYFNAFIPLPQNGPEGLKNQVYSWNYGNTHLVMLDSQQDEESMYGDILYTQKKWLDNDLAKSKATWDLAFFHKTPYPLMASRQNLKIREAFCPVFEKHNVSVVFNGHDHGVGRTFITNNTQFMEKPSQGTVYYMNGRSGTKFYKNIGKQPFNAFFYDPQDQPNYMVVNVKDKMLTVTAYKQDGTVLDTFSIDKKKDQLIEPMAQKK